MRRIRSQELQVGKSIYPVEDSIGVKGLGHQKRSNTFTNLDETAAAAAAASLSTDVTFTSTKTTQCKPPKSCLRRPPPVDRTRTITNSNDEATTRTTNTATPPPPSSYTTSKKNVSFHRIEIAEHEYELGDNPSVNGGCPIQIGWEPLQTIALDVDEYEGLRTKNNHQQRNREQMRLPAYVRDHLAKQAGASRSEMLEATQQAQQISKSRYRSIKAQPWDKLHYRLEITSRTLRKVTSVDGIKMLGKSTTQRSWSNVDLLRDTPNDNTKGRDAYHHGDDKNKTDVRGTSNNDHYTNIHCEKTETMLSDRLDGPEFIHEDDEKDFDEPLSF
ncbi:hypothetical protein IV203_015733 [Nitzschia inconspicua]|uniref:Uncharacterized protein n=1 Tax=Nitzschia inconspicua TaxID=303405 RepID=A0A9K3PVX7_9STRA|nr:hypothetical protein IV203_015733 [Nitzschia inconspicua]